jgi:hypothetical protein
LPHVKVAVRWWHKPRGKTPLLVSQRGITRFFDVSDAIAGFVTFNAQSIVARNLLVGFNQQVSKLMSLEQQFNRSVWGKDHSSPFVDPALLSYLLGRCRH